MAELNENIQREITRYIESLTSYQHGSDYDSFTELLTKGFDIVLNSKKGREDDYYIDLACATIQEERRQNEYIS
jgi:hypothetical protein